MSEKIKLIIEIDKDIYQEAVNGGYSHLYEEDVACAVQDGVPLEEVRTEINNLPRRLFEGYFHFKDSDVLSVLDNVSIKSEETE